MSRRTRAKPSEPFAPADPVQNPYSNALNADDSQIESLLSDHSDYIEANADRIPEFGSVSAARTELERLSSKIKELRSKPKSDYANRLSAVSHQRDSLVSGNEGIERLRAIGRDATAREDGEYSGILAEIDDLQTKLASLQKQNAQRKKAAETARAIREAAQSDLANRSAQCQDLKKEYRRLQQLEKQSNEELRTLQSEVQKTEEEQTVVADMEVDLKTKEANLRNLRGEIAKRKEIVDDKKNAILKLLQKAEGFEDEIDLVCEGKTVYVPEDTDQSAQSQEEDYDDQKVPYRSPPTGQIQSGSDEEDSAETEAVKAIRMPLPDSRGLRGRVEKATRSKGD
jgi:chromosome segregation ATPase